MYLFALQVSIFSLLDDSKFEHFKPVMDAYIKGHFAAALVYKYVRYFYSNMITTGWVCCFHAAEI